MISSSSEELQLLKQIQRYGFKAAITAGGFVRDSYLKKPYKDVDIFLWSPWAEDNIEVSTAIREESIEDTIYDMCQLADSTHSDDYAERATGEFDCADGNYSNSLISEVWNVEKNDISYQFIFTNCKPQVYVENHFDIGICKAFCDGTKISLLPDFLKDIRNKTLTVGNPEMSQKHFDAVLRKHLQRMKKQFPTHKVVVHPDMLSFVNDRNKHLL